MGVPFEKLLHQSIEGLAGNRSDRPEVLCKKGVHRNFENSQEKTCTRVSFLIRLQA